MKEKRKGGRVRTRNKLIKKEIRKGRKGKERKSVGGKELAERKRKIMWKDGGKQ
jgi:hypothetical protein